MYPMLSIDVTPEALMAVFIGMIVFSLIMCVTAVAVKRKKDSDNARLPMRREMAMVVDKQQVPADNVIMFGGPWVLFELQNGSRVRVTAPKSQSDLIIGDMGMLTWQGDQMISFARNNGYRQPEPVQQPTAASQWQKPAAPRGNPSAPEAKVTAEMETVFCSKCGRKQRKSNAVCWDCGAELKK